MHALRGTRTLLAGLALAAVVVGMVPRAANAWPDPKSKNVHLVLGSFSVGNYAPNRTSNGISTRGEFGVDPDGTGTVQGGDWPRGTIDNYVFNSGLEVTGIIGGTKSASNPWGGDTTWAKFFDPNGAQRHGEQVTPVYISYNPDDVANWPDVGLVPLGDTSEALFDPLLRGGVAASQGDAYLLTWEGDPANNSARTHPLGILAEYRALGWNYPSGNEDVVYLIITFYNITSANAADYAGARPAMASILTQYGSTFQSLNNAKFNITLPAGGYTINPMYAIMGCDCDVGNAGNNYSTVNFPYSMFITYEAQFDKGVTGSRFDPSVFGSPFFPGIGFVGYKYLKGPTGDNSIQLFTVTCNGCSPGDPGAGPLAFRDFAGQLLSTDTPCTFAGVTLVTHICNLRTGTGVDTRAYASSQPLVVPAGGQGSIVSGIVYAAPVLIPGFVPTSTTNVGPGNPLWIGSSDSINANHGVNKVDSMMGFLGYDCPLTVCTDATGLTNLDGSHHFPVQTDFSVVPQSLLSKALVAQSVFNNHFLLPFAPNPPAFFLIPGDKQVTVLWKPSSTETVGDPFAALAASPTTVTANGTQANSLYDPNYRKFDVEGYRIYRGRTDSPSTLTLLEQFDYAGTVFNDYTGTVQVGNCAPELTTAQVNYNADCPVAFGTVTQALATGVPLTVHEAYDIMSTNPLTTGPFIQVPAGGRTALATPAGGAGKIIVTTADTLVTGSADGGFPPLADTGVPFVFIDKAGTAGCGACGVNNGVTYYYSVSAFDVNSINSAPSSLESTRATQAVSVGAPASNYNNSGTLTSTINGRSGPLTDNTVATMDPTTGEFSKQSPPGNGLSLSLVAFATQVLKGTGSANMRFDSTATLSENSSSTNSIVDYFTVTTGLGTSVVSVPMSMSPTGAANVSAGGSFNAIAVDPTIAGIYGGGTGFTLSGGYTWTRPWMYITGVQERGCANASLGATGTVTAGFCYFNGPRWFSGANENTPNPVAQGLPAVGTTNTGATGSANPTAVTAGLRPDSGYVVAAGTQKIPMNWNNAGALPGVSVIYMPSGYGALTSTTWRDQDYLLSQYTTGADYKVYWGTAGKIDSVIDVTHNTVVPFSTRMVNSWGIINSTTVAGPGSEDLRGTVLTVEDYNCISPLRSFSTTSTGCTQAADSLTNTAVPGQIAFFLGAPANSQNLNLLAQVGGAFIPTAPVEPNNGFGLYIKGRPFIIELTGGALPSAGTVWTMRDYVGGIYGGNGKGTNIQFGAYAYYPSPVRQLNAPGASAALTYNVTNTVVAADATALGKVHTVPDPYYVTSAFDTSVITKIINFVNVPIGATIRIYSTSGVLVRVLQNTSSTNSGTVAWDVRNRSNQYVASGVYFYSVESGGISVTKRMTIVNFASNVQ